MRRFGDGLGVDPDVLRATDIAVAQALSALAGTPDLVTVFASSPDPDSLDDIGRRVAERTGARSLIGCSADGVIGAARGVEATTAVSVWAAMLPGARLRTFHLEVLRAEDGLAVVGMPPRHRDDHAAVLLVDPFSFPVDSFVERANDALSGLPFVGGIAGATQGAGSARLYIDGRTVERGGVGLMLGGDVGVRTVVSQGCRPIGPNMVVTGADENILLELAGAPALSKLEQILNDLDAADKALAADGVHIGIVMDEYAEDHERGDFLIRGVLGADRDRDAVVVGDRVPVGRTVRFQIRDGRAADEDLRALLTGLHAEAGAMGGALLFTCNGRGAHLFGPSLGGADHDVRMVREVLQAGGVGGFFANGEIGPVAGRNHLHGFTASVLAFEP